jgi:hypothetical protein
MSKSQVIKQPRLLLEGLFAFAPNRDTLGGVSYLIVENSGNILIDCPSWDIVNQDFLQQKGVRWIFLTHRTGHCKAIKLMQNTLGCEIILQEQEAYLLPEIPVTSFAPDIHLSPNSFGFWSAGYSPGSACFYWSAHGGVLFSGRHILPNPEGNAVPLRTAKTFHWYRQLKNVQAILDRFQPETLNYLAPCANVGFLRGKGLMGDLYGQISALDLQELRNTPIVD